MMVLIVAFRDYVNRSPKLEKFKLVYRTDKRFCGY